MDWLGNTWSWPLVLVAVSVLSSLSGCSDSLKEILMRRCEDPDDGVVNATCGLMENDLRSQFLRESDVLDRYLPFIMRESPSSRRRTTTTTKKKKRAAMMPMTSHDDDLLMRLFAVPQNFVADCIGKFQLRAVVLVFDSTSVSSAVMKVAGAVIARNAVELGVQVGFLTLPSSNRSVPILQNRSAWIVLQTSPIIEEWIIELSYLGYTNDEVIWLYNGDASDERFGRARILLDSNFWSVAVSEDKVILSEVYRRAEEESFGLRSCSIGIWTPQDGLQLSLMEKWERRRDLTGIVLRTATQPDPPFVLAQAISEQPGMVRLSGFYGDIWSSLQRVTNFSYTMVLSVDGSWGQECANGSFDGMVGMVLRDEVDMAVSDFYVTEGRARVVDFSVGVGSAPNQMYIRSPTENTGWYTYTNPFSIPMWWMVGAFMGFSAVVTFATFVAATTLTDKTKSGRKEEDYFSPGNSLFVALGALAQQGSSLEPRQSSLRCTLVTVFFTSSLIFAAYSAAFTSFLAVFRVKLPFDSFRTLYSQTDYKVGSLRGTAYDDVFRLGTPLHRRVYAERWEAVESYEEALTKIVSGEKYAFIWATDTMTSLFGKSCDLIPIKEIVYEGILTIVLKKEYPYKKLFDFFLSKLLETGQIDRMWSRWKPQARTDCFEADSVSGLGLNQVISAFWFLGAALVSSAILFLVEMVLMRKGRSRKVQGKWQTNEDSTRKRQKSPRSSVFGRFYSFS